MFLADSANLISIEYNNMDYSPNDWYFIDVEPKDCVTNNFWNGQKSYGNVLARVNYLSSNGTNDYSFTIQNENVSDIKTVDNQGNKISFQAKTCKYPYVCNYNTNKLFR